MKSLKAALALGAILGALYLLRSTFLSALGESPRAASPQAVLFSAPAGYRIEEAGSVAREEAARRLQAAMTASAAASVGIHFTSAGFETYWLVDQGTEPRIVERVAGPSGTRRETEYRGAIVERLAWAAEHGTLDAPGTSAGESRNLYH